MVFFLSIGIYSNLYIFRAFNARLLFTTALLPFGGFLFGGLTALIARLEWKLVKVSQLFDTSDRGTATCSRCSIVETCNILVVLF